MTAPLSSLPELLQRGFDAVEKGADPVLRPSTRPGVDFQANGALALAKRLGRPPREIAAEAVAGSGLEAVCSAVEVAPAGFVNLTLAPEYVSAEVARMAADPRLGVAGDAGRKVVVDYSAPNVAKEMHVGHLRSTIIGDALCRLLYFTGDAVVMENHIGDWGTPFVMIIERLVDSGA
ncbi:MAG: arginine--tRNA ligase, partial [Acidimicrobiales bacterium]